MIKPLSLIVIALALLVGASSASAATFVVNETSDLPDLDGSPGHPADAFCDVEDEGGANCTLRAAIQEANDTPIADNIHFALPANTTLALESTLPIISTPVTLDGCSGAAATGPCVGVRTNATSTSYAIGIGGAGITISGLAMTHATQGIFVGSGAAGATIRNNWIGLKLDGSAEGNDRGISVSADDVFIGGAAAADRNVISANNTGVSVFTGDRTRILGNRIGTSPNGGSASANTTAINLSGRGTTVGVDRPENTVIGGALSPAEQATAECDGPCNVIVANGTGINLGVDNANSSAAKTVEIAGNYVGLNAGGFGAFPAVHGIELGQADGVTIGGLSVAQRNVITAINRAITGDRTGIEGLTIRTNLVGTNHIGDFRLGDLAQGAILVRSTASAPATIANNLIAIGRSYGLKLTGSNATVNGNYIGIAPDGIGDIGNTAEAGSVGIDLFYNPDGLPATANNAITDNKIGNAGLAAIKIQGSFANTLTGNSIGTDGAGHEHANGSYGVLIESATASAARQTVIGGETPASANEISNNPLAGIRIRSSALHSPTANEIGQLRGVANGTAAAAGTPGMIDLGVEGPGNDDVHSGLRAPTVVLSSRDRVVGLASPTSTVRIYSKAGGNPGELSGLLAKGTAGNDGVFQIAYPSQQPDGRIVTATQTLDGGTSELGNAKPTVAPAGEAGTPETTIDGPVLTNDPTPSFDLGSNRTAGAYICRFIYPDRDSGGFYVPCDDPFVTPTLPEATGFRLIVRAISSDGLVDPGPAEHVFDVDLTAPGAPQITGGPEGPTEDTTPTFTFGGDVGNELHCAIDGAAAQPCDAGEFTPATALAPGAHQFAVTQADAAGNESAAATRAFSVTVPDTDPDPDPNDPKPDDPAQPDRTAPETTITKAPKRKLQLKAAKAKAKVKLAFGSNESGSFTCAVDGGPAKPCSSPAKLKLRAGKHTIAVAATDRAGNTDPTPAIAKVKVKR